MPDYIASGKDMQNECSIKVTAFTDFEAFQAAKRQIPIVSKLERIEADGSLTTTQGLPFDDIRTELRSLNEEHFEDGTKATRGQLPDSVRLAVAFIVVLAVVFRLARCMIVLNNSNVRTLPAPQSQPAP